MTLLSLLPKLWNQLTKNGHNFSKKVASKLNFWPYNDILQWKRIWKIQIIFWHGKLTLKVRNWNFLSADFGVLVRDMKITKVISRIGRCDLKFQSYLQTYLFLNFVRSFGSLQIQLINYLFCFSVRAIRGSQDVTIRVSDQGGGIPRRMTDTLFEYLYTTAPTPAITSSVDMPGKDAIDF